MESVKGAMRAYLRVHFAAQHAVFVLKGVNLVLTPDIQDLLTMSL